MTGRGLRGRRIARLIVALTLVLDAILAQLVLAGPTTMGGSMGFEGQSGLSWLILAIGAAFHIVGLAWMIRIYRTDPEAHASHWRFDRS